jgi:hypothetical protein
MTFGRDGVPRLLEAVAAWPERDRPVTGLHVGDVGWHLRLHDDAVDDAFEAWWDGEDLLAYGLVEGIVGRYAVRPGLETDGDLAETIARSCEALDGDEVYADLPAGSAAHALLAGRGWTDDPDPWIALHADLTEWHPTADLTGVRVVEAADAVADRVAVQRAGFEGSTFTEEAWHRMAAGPGYRRDLDVVVSTADGVPAAIATAWWPGPASTAILEPVATHHDLRGQGWGGRAVATVLGRLRDLGAPGVSVSTPLDFTAAVATDRSAGLRDVGELRSLVRQRGQSTA